MKFSMLVATAIACLLSISTLVNAESPDRKNIKSVYSSNNSLPSAAEIRSIAQAIKEYYRQRNERANLSSSSIVNGNKYAIFEEVTEIALVELKMSPVTRSKVAKVNIHIVERSYNRMSKQGLEQMQTSLSSTDRNAMNNNSSRKYLWKLDREQIIEGKLLIDRWDNNTWKVTGTAMAVTNTKLIK
jgi:hypothetical protein